MTRKFTIDRHRIRSMDLALSVATELATICVNLDEQIDRHEPLICCRGGYATVSQGTLHVDGIKVAIKTERSPGDGSAIKASNIDYDLQAEI